MTDLWGIESRLVNCQVIKEEAANAAVLLPGRKIKVPITPSLSQGNSGSITPQNFNTTSETSGVGSEYRTQPGPVCHTWRKQSPIEVKSFKEHEVQ